MKEVRNINKEKREIKIYLEGVYTIYEGQSIVLKNHIPTILYGLNGVGKSSILKGIKSINGISNEDRTTYLRSKHDFESRYKDEEDIVGISKISIPLFDNELEKIKKLLQEMDFLDEEKINKYIEIFKKEGKVIGSNTNGDNSIGLYFDSKKNKTNLLNIIEEFLNIEKILISSIMNKEITLYETEMKNNFNKLFSEFNTNVLALTPLKDKKIKNMNKIINILKEKPRIINLNQAATKGKEINLSYNIGELFEDQHKDNRNIKDLFNFLYPKYNNLKKYYECESTNSQKIKLRTSISKEINQKMETLLRKFDVHFKIDASFDGNNINLQILTKNDWLIGNNEPTNESDGNRAFLQFIITISSILKRTQTNKNKENFILIADEPEKNLSLSLQYDLKKYILDKLNKNTKGNLFIIYATHSPVMYDENANNYFIERSQLAGDTKIISSKDKNSKNSLEYFSELSQISKIYKDKSRKNY